MSNGTTLPFFVRGELCWSSLEKPRRYDETNQEKYEATIKVSATEYERINEIIRGYEDSLGIKDSDKRKVIWCAYESKEGDLFIKLSSSQQPATVNREKTQIPPSAVWDGCKVIVTGSFWFQDNKFGKRINAFLNGVMLFKEGERKTRNNANTFEGIEVPTDIEDVDNLPF